MRVILLLVLLSFVALAMPAEAEPPKPGGHCEVKEEYVTEASLGSGGPTSLPTVQPGAPRPIECYY